MKFRKGTNKDLTQIKQLGLNSWKEYKNNLTDENWNKLYNSLNSNKTYSDLLNISECIVCENEKKEIIGMAFFVPSGNPTEIYDTNWCQLRFVSVNTNYRGKKIGETLIKKCIEIANFNKEKTMALHTSEIMSGARYIYEKIGFKKLKEIQPRLGVRYWIYLFELKPKINLKTMKI